MSEITELKHPFKNRLVQTFDPAKGSVVSAICKDVNGDSAVLRMLALESSNISQVSVPVDQVWQPRFGMKN